MPENDNLPDLSDLTIKVPKPRDYHDLSNFAQQEGFTVRSTTGGTHNRGSKHYQGLAVDVRSRDKTPEQIAAMMAKARDAGIVVRDERTRPPGQRVWGGPHIHLEVGGNNAPAAQSLPDLSDLTQGTQSQLPDLSDLSAQQSVTAEQPDAPMPVAPPLPRLNVPAPPEAAPTVPDYTTPPYDQADLPTSMQADPTATRPRVVADVPPVAPVAATPDAAAPAAPQMPALPPAMQRATDAAIARQTAPILTPTTGGVKQAPTAPVAEPGYRPQVTSSVRDDVGGEDVPAGAAPIAPPAAGDQTAPDGTMPKRMALIPVNLPNNAGVDLNDYVTRATLSSLGNYSPEAISQFLKEHPAAMLRSKYGTGEAKGNDEIRSEAPGGTFQVQTDEDYLQAAKARLDELQKGLETYMGDARQSSNPDIRGQAEYLDTMKNSGFARRALEAGKEEGARLGAGLEAVPGLAPHAAQFLIGRLGEQLARHTPEELAAGADPDYFDRLSSELKQVSKLDIPPDKLQRLMAGYANEIADTRQYAGELKPATLQQKIGDITGRLAAQLATMAVVPGGPATKMAVTSGLSGLAESPEKGLGQALMGATGGRVMGAAAELPLGPRVAANFGVGAIQGQAQGESPEDALWSGASQVAMDVGFHALGKAGDLRPSVAIRSEWLPENVRAAVARTQGYEPVIVANKSGDGFASVFRNPETGEQIISPLTKEQAASSTRSHRRAFEVSDEQFADVMNRAAKSYGEQSAPADAAPTSDNNPAPIRYQLPEVGRTAAREADAPIEPVEPPHHANYQPRADDGTFVPGKPEVPAAAAPETAPAFDREAVIKGHLDALTENLAKQFGSTWKKLSAVQKNEEIANYQQVQRPSVERFVSAIESKDGDALKQWLKPENKTSRATFAQLTGVDLGNTEDSMRAAVDQYAGAPAPTALARTEPAAPAVPEVEAEPVTDEEVAASQKGSDIHPALPAGSAISQDGAIWVVRGPKGEILGANQNRDYAIKNAVDQQTGTGDYVFNAETGQMDYMPGAGKSAAEPAAQPAIGESDATNGRLLTASGEPERQAGNESGQDAKAGSSDSSVEGARVPEEKPGGVQEQVNNEDPFAGNDGDTRAATEKHLRESGYSDSEIERILNQSKGDAAAAPTEPDAIEAARIRELNRAHNLSPVPESTWRFFDKEMFDKTPNAAVVPTDELYSTKDESQDPRVIAGEKRHPVITAHNAFLKVQEGSDGFKPRKPLLVAPRKGGGYTVLDGNATTQAAQVLGWKQMPVEVADTPRVIKGIVGEKKEKDAHELFHLYTAGRPDRAAELARAARFGEHANPTPTQIVNNLRTSAELEARMQESHMKPFVDQYLPEVQAEVDRYGREEQPFQSRLNRIADTAGAEVHHGPLKHPLRIIEKAVQEAKPGDPLAFSYKDTVRSSFIAPDAEAMGNIVGHVLETYPPAPSPPNKPPKNRFANPTAEGYSDLLMNVDMGGGDLAEVQFHVPEMIDAKKQGHPLYREQDTLEGIAKHRELTTEERDRLQAARDGQVKLYGAARRAFESRTNSSFDTLIPSLSAFATPKNLGGSVPQNNTANPPLAVGTNATGISSTSNNSGSSSVEGTTSTSSPTSLNALNGLDKSTIGEPPSTGTIPSLDKKGEAPIGPHGKFSSFLRQTTPIIGSEDMREPFAGHPAVRALLGLPPGPPYTMHHPDGSVTYATRGAEGTAYQAAMQETLDHLADAVGRPRSSHIDKDVYEEWLGRNADVLPEDAIDSYVSTVARFGRHLEDVLAFNKEARPLLRGIEDGSNDTASVKKQIIAIGKTHGVSKAIAEATIAEARNIRNGVPAPAGTDPETTAATPLAETSDSAAGKGSTAETGGSLRGGVSESGGEGNQGSDNEAVAPSEPDGSIIEPQTEEATNAKPKATRKRNAKRQPGLFEAGSEAPGNVGGAVGQAGDGSLGADEPADVSGVAPDGAAERGGDSGAGSGETEIRGTGGRGNEPAVSEGDSSGRTEELPAARNPEEIRAAIESRFKAEQKRRADQDRMRQLSAKRHEDVTHQTSPALASNYRITDPATHAPGSPSVKFQNNLEALRTMRNVIAEGRPATPEEQQILANWVGWGQFPQVFNPNAVDYADARRWDEKRKAVREMMTPEEFDAARGSTLNAHYTAPEIIAGMWDAMGRMGFKGGRILEPAMGSGNFFGLLPESMNGTGTRLTGVELDKITGGVARLLYPQADVQIQGFEEHNAPDNYYDLAISNVPFGDYKVHDPVYNKFGANIHDYFFLKSLDKVRPGGMVAFITSTGTMDKQNSRLREQIAKRGDLVAAFRLPGETFQKNAGTAVVTDLIFLRKRGPDEAATGESWMDLGKVPDPAFPDTDYKQIPVNEYYVNHPENILGTLDRSGSMYRSDAVNVTPPADFPKAFNEAIQRLPKDAFKPREVKSHAFEPQVLPAPGDVKEGGYHVDESGKVFQRSGGAMVEQKIPATQRTIIKGIIGVRDVLRKVIAADLDFRSDDAVEARKELHAAYDAFVKKHGYLNAKANATAFADDPDAFLVQALENYDPKRKTATKQSIFEHPNITRYVPPDKVDNINDAVATSLNEYAGVNMDRIQALLGKDKSQVAALLSDSGLAFYDPTGGWTHKELYLSGNVRRKLREVEALVGSDPRYQANVDALKAVIPEDIEAADIDAKMGASWIPPGDVEEFLASLVDGSPSQFKAVYVPADGSWDVDYAGSGRNLHHASANSRQIWGTEDYPLIDVAQAVLSRRAPIVTDSQWDAEKQRNVPVPDKEATDAARDKVKKMSDRFSEWVWEDADRAKRLHRYYNDTMNNTADVKWDGSHLQFPGMSPEWRAMLHQHIKDSIWRNVVTGVALDAHEVGTGKTAVQVGTAMEWKRLGLARKPAIVTLKSVINQFAREAREIYPNINLLSTSSNFSGKQRKTTLARMATGDHDLVLMTHPNIDALPMSAAVREEFVRRELNELDEAIRASEEANGRGNEVVKRLEKAKKRLQARLKEAIDAGQVEDAIDFESTGIDGLLVDEAHFYKSLPVYTSMERVKGISTQRSNRATNMFMRTRWLLERHGRNVVFATGTPVSNSIVELYTMQKYLQYPQLEERGLQSFDAWARNFGEISTSMEYAVTGELKQQSRFASWSNLGELVQLSRQMMDVVFADDVPSIQRPRKHYRVHGAEMSPDQEAYMREIQSRAEALSQSGADLTVDNMLKITTDARQAAVDMRLIDPTLPDHPGSKVNLLVDEVLRQYRETPNLTQMIFSDVGVSDTKTSHGVRVQGFSVFKDIINKLVADGVPRDKIINFSDLKDTEKEGASGRLKSGNAIIGMGSTATLGTGVNAQDLGVAQHHLDAPWIPAAVEQREGRYFRHGNKNADVTINRYLTTGSFDKFMWQTIDRKWRAILALMKGDRSMRRIIEEDTEEMSPAQMKALASGNPLEHTRVNLEREVNDLEGAARRHVRDQSRLRETIPRLEDRQQRYTLQADGFADDAAHYDTVKGTPLSVQIQGKTYTDMKQAMTAMRAAYLQVFANGSDQWKTVGNYNGFTIEMRKSRLNDAGVVGQIGRREHYEFNIEPDEYKQVIEPIHNEKGEKLGERYVNAKDTQGRLMVEKPTDGGLGSLRYGLQRIHKRVQPLRDEIDVIAKNIESTRAQLGKPFKSGELLDKKRTELADVIARLQADPHGVGEDDAANAAVAGPMGADEVAARMAFQSQVLMAQNEAPTFLPPPGQPSRWAGQAGFLNVGSLLAGKRTSSAREIITSLRRAGLLAAVKMHMRNFAGNAGFAVSDEFARPLAALADIAMSKQTGVRTKAGADLASVGRAVFGKQGGVIKGTADFLSVIKHGDQSKGAAHKYQMRELQSGMPIIDAYANLVLRTVEAADRPAKAYAVRRELDSLAKAQALTEAEEFRKSGRPGTFDRTAREKFLREHPTEEMQREAVTYSEIATFQNDNPISAFISDLKSKAEKMTGVQGGVAKAAKLAFELKYPFDRTPTNIFLRMLEYTPVGVGMAAHRYRQGLQGALSRTEQARLDTKAAAVKENASRLRDYEKKLKQAQRDAETVNNKQRRAYQRDVQKAWGKAQKEYEKSLMEYYEAAAQAAHMSAGLFADAGAAPTPPDAVTPDLPPQPREVPPIPVRRPDMLDPETLAAAIADEVMSKEDQRRFAETVGRAGLGNALGAMAILLLAKGLLDLSGATDYDDEKDKYFEKRRLGIRDGSLRVPGTNLRFQITGNPLGNVLVALATAYEQGRRQGAVLDRAKAATKGAVEIAKQQPLLKGQLEDSSDKRDWKEKVAEFGAGFMPRVGGEVGEVLDPSARKSYGQGAAAQFKRNIPVPLPFNRGSLPVQENVVGGPQERGGIGRRILRGLDPFEVTRQAGAMPTSARIPEGGPTSPTPRISVPSPRSSRGRSSRSSR